LTVSFLLAEKILFPQVISINDQLMSGFIKYNNTHKHPEYKDQTGVAI